MIKNNDQNIKHISDIVGELGKWQINFIIFSVILRAISALCTMGYVFNAYSNDFWCSDVPEHIPVENRTTMMKCFQYTNPNQSCTEWQYDRSQFRTSITTEFNLVCEQANFGSITQSVFMSGFVVSGLVFAHYADKYGRLPIIWISITIQLFGILMSGLSVNIYMYGLSRFMTGLGSSGLDISHFTILIEMCGPKYRSDILITVGSGWVFGNALIPLLAYWLQDFRLMHFVSAVPLILMMIWLYFLDESPRWQLTKGRTQKAEKTLRKALKMSCKSDFALKEQLNELSLPLGKVEANGEITKSHTLLDLFKTPTIRKITLIMLYSYTMYSLIYYGLSFNMSDFGGNFYITFLLASLVDLPAKVSTAIFLRFVGRSKLFGIGMTLTALSCFSVIPFDKNWFKIMFALIGKLGANSLWTIMSVHGPELYPTILRETGMGFTSVVGKFGSVSAPFMKYLAANYGLTSVMVLYGSLATFGAILGLLLPETKGREIPDTIEEAENRRSIEFKVID